MESPAINLPGTFYFWNLPALIATLAVETTALVVWRKISGRACKRCLLALVPLNVFTQGMLFTGLFLSPYPYWRSLALLEGVVLLVEAAGYWLAERPSEALFSFAAAFKLSLTLNCASFLIGLLLPF